MDVFVVDAFTDQPFRGNPAGVVLMTEPRPDEWMQQVAAELKHAETAFVDVTGGEVLPLRWFTPLAEVDLCGHATLATAHVLGGTRRFSTRSGELVCNANRDGWVEMDFPADNPLPAELPAEVLPGVAPVSVARGVSDYLVEVGTAAEVRALAPDLDAVAALPARGLIVTAPGEAEGIDFVSRCFYPAVGVPEDPVTGSAHCALAPWWAARTGRSTLVGEQASVRGGVVRVTLRDDRVGLSGRAVQVLRGVLSV
ncbi:PhzF family phenazine biosynthesis protein [Kutzneria viridogrisea]|uniref:PhzF superfamily epimerase YddE/YHI9 n=1 Tax=Kutzneria viridogrisea TaxID=47990 RepID=A0ABR6BYG6_9PSEU|nr:putative PhzF superfamily epimerase YddE/YHI9 [Kutzneria viridogrisea]